MNSDLINQNLTLRLAFNFRHDITFLYVVILHEILTAVMCSVIKRITFLEKNSTLFWTGVFRRRPTSIKAAS